MNFALFLHICWLAVASFIGRRSYFLLSPLPSQKISKFQDSLQFDFREIFQFVNNFFWE
jgi:hypothetical protein